MNYSQNPEIDEYLPVFRVSLMEDNLSRLPSKSENFLLGTWKLELVSSLIVDVLLALPASTTLD